jgi:hypothetical protein
LSWCKKKRKKQRTAEREPRRIPSRFASFKALRFVEHQKHCGWHAVTRRGYSMLARPHARLAPDVMLRPHATQRPQGRTRSILAFRSFVLRRRCAGTNNTVVLLVDLKGTGLHLNVHVILFGRFRGYSPRVPAGEASAIFEGAFLNDFALRIGNGELWLRRAAVVDDHVATNLTRRADQR